MTVILHGKQEALSYLAKLADASTAFGRSVVGAATKKVYAYGIETGRRRDGRTARKAGGVYYMRGGLRKVEPSIRERLAKAVKGGPDDVQREQKKIAEDVRDAAQDIVVVRSGELQRSIYPVYPGGSIPADEGARHRSSGRGKTRGRR